MTPNRCLEIFFFCFRFLYRFN